LIRQYNVDYYMVSVDTLEDNTKFAQTHEADYPIMSDVSKSVANAYGVLGPGNVARRWTFYIGPDGKILHIDKAVSPSTSGPDMVKQLGELNVPKK
jgi:peroxiredoxin Q/BCP